MSGLVSAIQPFNIIRYDLEDGTLGPVLGYPGAALKTAVHRDKAAFGQVVGDELCRTPKGDDIEEVRLIVTVLILCNAVDGDTQMSDSHALGRVLHLRVFSKTTDQDNTIERHDVSPSLMPAAGEEMTGNGSRK
jgi:hypothetical protein